MDPVPTVVFPLVLAVSVALWIWTRLSGSPLIAVGFRWSVWLLMACNLALAFVLLGADGGRPWWTLALVGALIWFLIESGYHWLAISAVSQSDLPLFPPFRRNESGEEWPNDRGNLRLREDIRRLGLQKIAALKAELAEQVTLRASVFQSPDATVRLQVLFLPNLPPATPRAIVSLTSELSDGTRLVTDNYYLPFGGFFPDHWRVERTPLQRHLRRLWERHQTRLRTVGEGRVAVPLTGDVLDDVLHQQRLLEKANLDAGFLHAPQDRDEQGRLTTEGRYRVWVEQWLLNYLGRPLRR